MTGFEVIVGRMAQIVVVGGASDSWLIIEWTEGCLVPYERFEPWKKFLESSSDFKM